MNITFLIGNGFDLNLGLNTRYSDFLAVYKTIREEDSNFIQFMKKRINEDSILWSDAELALGDSTKYLIGDDEKTRFDAVEAFSNFHIDICMRLASYLEEQQSRLPSFDNPEEIAKKMAICLNGFANGFREESRNMIQNSYITAKGGINFNFIVFNYTQILDDLLNITRSNQKHLGTRNHSGTLYQNTIGEIIHVHGTTKRDMVFAVNDISQITNKGLYTNVPDVYLQQLIKIETNRINEQRTDEKTTAILNASDLIYIYGMSLGETDRMWWQRIVELMKANTRLCVIIQQVDADDEALIRKNFLIKRNSFRERFVGFLPDDVDNKEQIKERIFLTSYNIFNEFKDIVHKETIFDFAKKKLEEELNTETV